MDTTGRTGIPRSMQLVAGRTGLEYNQRKRRKGAFWEDRYHAVAIEFTAKGREKMNKLSFEHEGSKLAIVVNGTLYSAPVLREHIIRGASISGDFTEAEAKSLVQNLNLGSLPVKLVPVPVPTAP